LIMLKNNRGSDFLEVELTIHFEYAKKR